MLECYNIVLVSRAKERIIIISCVCILKHAHLNHEVQVFIKSELPSLKVLSGSIF